jgi:hypothetical protein
MSEPVQENTGVEVDPELEEEDTELENQNAKTTSTMGNHESEIESYLERRHQFTIEKDAWEVYGPPLHDTKYDHFTKAVYNCRLVHRREAVPFNTIVKIWIEYVTILTVSYMGRYVLTIVEELKETAQKRAFIAGGIVALAIDLGTGSWLLWRKWRKSIRNCRARGIIS